MIPYTGGPHAALERPRRRPRRHRDRRLFRPRRRLAGRHDQGHRRRRRRNACRASPTCQPSRETLPGFFAGGWNVMLAPNGTPPPIIDKVGVDMRKALDEPGRSRSKLAALGASTSDDAGGGHRQPRHDDLAASRRARGEGRAAKKPSVIGRAKPVRPEGRYRRDPALRASRNASGRRTAPRHSRSTFGITSVVNSLQRAHRVGERHGAEEQ